jgi:hypothetical protein
MPQEPLRAQVNKCITEAAKPHSWLHELITNDVIPDTNLVGVDGAINGLLSMIGGVINALDLIAAELDRQRDLLSGSNGGRSGV